MRPACLPYASSSGRSKSIGAVATSKSESRTEPMGWSPRMGERWKTCTTSCCSPKDSAAARYTKARSKSQRGLSERLRMSVRKQIIGVASALAGCALVRCPQRTRAYASVSPIIPFAGRLRAFTIRIHTSKWSGRLPSQGPVSPPSAFIGTPGDDRHIRRSPAGDAVQSCGELERHFPSARAAGLRAGMRPRGWAETGRTGGHWSALARRLTVCPPRGACARLLAPLPAVHPQHGPTTLFVHVIGTRAPASEAPPWCTAGLPSVAAPRPPRQAAQAQNTTPQGVHSPRVHRGRRVAAAQGRPQMR